MNFVIPMAGYGARFVAAGHEKPKMLLEAHGKTLLQWSLQSLPLHLADRVIFVGLRKHEQEFNLQAIIEGLYPELSTYFIFLDEVTRGQAETTWKAIKYCKAQEPLIIFNIDTFFKSSTLANHLCRADVDGVLGSFYSTENRFSFASLDEQDEFVVNVKEKEVISNHALTGLYTFKNIDDFAQTYLHHIAHNLTTKGEYYIAPMYNYLIEQGKKYILDPAEQHYILGTPEEYNAFMLLDSLKDISIDD